jgi:hypothetical protein
VASDEIVADGVILQVEKSTGLAGGPAYRRRRLLPRAKVHNPNLLGAQLGGIHLVSLTNLVDSIISIHVAKNANGVVRYRADVLLLAR